MVPKLPTRKLGKNGPDVTALGFGTMGLSVFYGPVGSDEERLDFLDKVYETGCTNWDSADMYGDSEELIGKWFKRSGKRNDIFLATKFANRFGANGLEVHNDPSYIREAFQTSLNRLGVEQVDLFYCHRFNGKVPVEDIIRTMKEFVDAGKVKYLGISECSAETLRRAHAVHPIHAVQIEYSPFTIDIEHEKIGLLKACRELGVATVAYSPLGRGMLTGALKGPEDLPEGDFRGMLPRYSKENFPKNLELVSKLQTMAQKKKCTASQLTLAWLLAQGDDIIPIPGTKKEKYLHENLAALDVQLSAEENKEIRAAIENAEVAGTRYPEAAMAGVFADTPRPK